MNSDAQIRREAGTLIWLLRARCDQYVSRGWMAALIRDLWPACRHFGGAGHHPLAVALHYLHRQVVSGDRDGLWCTAYAARLRAESEP